MEFNRDFVTPAKMCDDDKTILMAKGRIYGIEKPKDEEYISRINKVKKETKKQTF